jgi:hypothetical protein
MESAQKLDEHGNDEGFLKENWRSRRADRAIAM